MKILSLSVSFLLLSSLLSAQSFNKVLVFGSGDAAGYAVDVDNSGNIFTAGRFEDTVDFDPGSGVERRIAKGENDIYLAKIKSSGDLDWVYTFGYPLNTTIEWGLGVGVDKISGHSYITGAINGTTDFDPSPDSLIVRGNGSGSAFLASLKPDGSLNWVVRVSPNNFSRGQKIRVAPDGSIYFTGQFSGKSYFISSNGDSLSVPIAAANDPFLCKVSADGIVQWVRQWGGSGSGSTFQLSLDKDGRNIYVVGMFTGQFVADSVVPPVVSNGDDDIFFAKVDSSGKQAWVRVLGSKKKDWGQGIAVDDWGGVYVTGYFYDTVNFNTDPVGSPLLKIAPSKSRNIFLLKTDANGKTKWAKTYGTKGLSEGWALATDTKGRVVFGGYFSDTLDLGSTTVGPALPKNSSNSLIIRMDTGGTSLDYYPIFSKKRSQAYDVWTDASGDNIFASGFFTDTCDFDPGSGLHIKTTGLVRNGYILHLGPGGNNGGNTGNTGGGNDTSSFVSEIPHNSDFKIYPNPTDGVSIVELKNTAESVNVCVYNSIGQRVWKNGFKHTNSFEVDLREEPAGFYFVEIISNQGRRVIKLMKK